MSRFQDGWIQLGIYFCLLQLHQIYGHFIETVHIGNSNYSRRYHLAQLGRSVEGNVSLRPRTRFPGIATLREEPHFTSVSVAVPFEWMSYDAEHCSFGTFRSANSKTRLSCAEVKAVGCAHLISPSCTFQVAITELCLSQLRTTDSWME